MILSFNYETKLLNVLMRFKTKLHNSILVQKTDIHDNYSETPILNGVIDSFYIPV